MSFRRKQEQRDQVTAAADAQDQPAKDEGATAAVASISAYSLRNNIDEHDDRREDSAERGGTDEGPTAGADEPAQVPPVGEEVQAILVSAQEAAAKIRRRAEDEAERVRNEAASAADAEVADARRAADAERIELDRLRAEAEAYATETRAAADAAAEQRWIEAEGEAARILEEVQRRRDAVAELAPAEAAAHERVATLQNEIERQEERLDSILVVLRQMSAQVASLLGRQEESDDLPDAIANIPAKR